MRSSAPQACVVSIKAAMNCLQQVSVDDGQLGHLLDDPFLLRALMRRRFLLRRHPGETRGEAVKMEEYQSTRP